MGKSKIFSVIITLIFIVSLTIPIVKAEGVQEKNAVPQISYNSFVQGQGWEKDFVKDGQQSGTTGKSKAIEGFKINIANLGKDVKVKYRVHSRDIGWQSWKENGQISGTIGRNAFVEAIEIKLENTKDYAIEYRAHVQDIGWQGWKKDGELAGTTGKVKSIEAIQIRIIKRGASVVYNAYIQNSGWQGLKSNGATAGTTGQAKKIYALNIDTVNYNDLQLEYQIHAADIGWMNWIAGGKEAGSKDKNKSIEAIKIKIKNSNKYRVTYRVHVSDIGWQGWKKNGELAGTTGQAKAIEAIEIKIEERPATVTYRSHVQDIGWQDWKTAGVISGTTGQVKAIEALNIQTINYDDGLKLEYQVHVRDIGWMDWVDENQQAGTTGKAKPIEAVKIRIKNQNKYSVMYRVHAQDIGWMDWVYDGALSGTTGQVKSIEAIQIKIVPKVNIITEISTYGKSGLRQKGDSRGSDLQYYRFGQGPNVMFATFTVHGFEDKWGRDGTELTLIANEFFDRLKNGNYQDIANKWTVYIFPEVNPDGRRVGTTNNGPGRTTLFSQAPGNKGIDINRCWQINGVPYTRYTDNRNYNGTTGFQAYEAKALRDFLTSHKSASGQTILIDLHGWTNQLIGDPGICNTYYYPNFKNADRSSVGKYGTGYLVNWARSSLGSSRANAKSALIELPSNGINNHNDVVRYNLPGRYIDSTINMLRNISVPSGVKAKARASVASVGVQEINQEEQYNIALAGMIKNNKPEENEITKLIKQGPLNSNGLWIPKQSRTTFEKFINKYTNLTYKVDDKGFARIAEKDADNENKINSKDEKNKYDNLLEKLITSNKQYIINQTGQYYFRDHMTRNIENNSFEKMDKYQVYEYVDTGDKMAIILTSNLEGKLSDKDILDSLVELIK